MQASLVATAAGAPRPVTTPVSTKATMAEATAATMAVVMVEGTPEVAMRAGAVAEMEEVAVVTEEEVAADTGSLTGLWVTRRPATIPRWRTEVPWTKLNRPSPI